MNAKFAIETSVQDAAVLKLIEHLTKIAELSAKAGGSIATSFDVAAIKQQATAKKTLQVETQTLDERKKKALQTDSEIQAAEQRLNAASKKGLDAVRQSIFEFEEKKRKLALETAHTLDDIRKKEIKDETAKINAELQLYRSAEKDKMKARTFSEQLEKAPKGGGAVAGLMGGIGVGAVISGFQALKANAEKADAANDMLMMGLGSTGLQGTALMKEQKEQTINAKKMADEFKNSEEEVKDAMGKIATLSGKSGQELRNLTEDAIIMSKSTGQSVETVAKILGKATNEEIESGATKLGIALDKNMNAEQRANKLHEEAMKRKKSVIEADNDALGSAQKIMNKTMTTITTLASTILDALKPAFDAILPLVDQVGALLSATLAPILEALTPVITLIAEAFAQLAPPIIELVQAALGILTPILTEITGLLSNIIPVVVEVVKTILTSLTPVFKALAPVLQELAEILMQVFSAELMNIIVPIIKDVFVPILTDLVVPILLALLPLIKQLADLFMKLVVPAIQGVSSVMKWLIDNAIKPLVQWLSGTLVAAIQSVIGVVSEVVGAITSVASAVGDLLGLGDDEPKKAVQKQVQAVAEVHESGEQKITDIHDKAEEARKKKAEADAKKAAAAGAKATKSKYEIQKDIIEEALTEQKALIDTANSKGQLSDADAKRDLLEAQLNHDKQMLDLAVKFHQKTTQLKAQLAKTEAEIRKNDQAQILNDAKADTELLLAELDIRAMKEELSEKEIADAKYQIERTALENEIYLHKQAGDDISKLSQQLTAMDLKQALSGIADRKRIEAELRKNKLEARKDAIELAKLQGKEVAEIERQLATDEENNRFAEEMERRKKEFDGTKLGNALKESLEIDHQNKLNAIDAKASKERLDANKEFYGDLLDLATTTGKEREKSALDFAQKQLGIQNASLLAEQGGIKKFALLNLQTIAQNQLAQITATQLGEAKKTALVVAGVAARGAQLVGEGIASAASAAGTWIATAAKAVYNAFEAMPFPLDIIAAIGAVGGVVALATQVPKMFNKHAAGTDNAPGGMSLVGELGPELVDLPKGSKVIPNHRISGAMQAPDFKPLEKQFVMMNQKLSDIHTASVNPRFVTAIDSYQQVISQKKTAMLFGQQKLFKN